jgi:hypothetical protein
MKKTTLLVVIAVSGLLVACTAKGPVSPPNWAHAVQTAETREAHEALAKHYEDVAKQMQADADEEKKMLVQYLATPWKYGKHIQDLKAGAEKMIRDFELAAKESLHMAEYHRQLAAEIK